MRARKVPAHHLPALLQARLNDSANLRDFQNPPSVKGSKCPQTGTLPRGPTPRFGRNLRPLEHALKRVLVITGALQGARTQRVSQLASSGAA